MSSPVDYSDTEAPAIHAANARAIRLDRAVDRVVECMALELVITCPQDGPRPVDPRAPRLRALVRAILAEIL